MLGAFHCLRSPSLDDHDEGTTKDRDKDNGAETRKKAKREEEGTEERGRTILATYYLARTRLFLEWTSRSNIT